MADQEQAMRRLRWRCRRGMKEMDGMLSHFLELGDDAWPDGCFPVVLMERLLDAQDDQLWQWLIGRALPEDPELAELVNSIRHCAGAS